ncbi:aldo/keto reductase [Halorubellus sp. JP-L1]|uniref:aldo/keto reductase n=1 Tax=Halorubellus sp. JP-L1 TaxID=2715753 RepID=UPI00140C1EF1|nr:aldo/keto reductase [Halorubellus sp. JP-L1]NHN42759.1 aldo/keto reductase [Halorubellus sp. JP-L1]
MTRDTIPDLGIGTAGLEPGTCEESVRHALDVGYRHVDTAQMYENQGAVGDGIQASTVDRDDVFLATKILPRNLAYDDVLDQFDRCRERLGVDVVDLLYVHWPIEAYDPEETLRAFDELHDDGVVRHVGLSNFTPSMLDEARDHLDASIFAHQVECHPLLQQDELRAYADEHDHELVAYSPLAKGAVFDVPELVDIAAKHDATPAQVSLAWLRAKAVTAIPRSSSAAHIEENYAARELELDDEDVARIDAIERTERQIDPDDAPWTR